MAEVDEHDGWEWVKDSMRRGDKAALLREVGQALKRFETKDSDVAEDMINHPTHYTDHPSGVECITVVEHMGFCLGNAVKYIWRADLKGDATTDLKKARWYIDREIERRGGLSEADSGPQEVPGDGDGAVCGCADCLPSKPVPSHSRIHGLPY